MFSIFNAKLCYDSCYFDENKGYNVENNIFWVNIFII